MKHIKKGYLYILIGLLCASFIIAIQTDDPWGLLKPIYYLISLMLIVIGFMEIIYAKNINKTKVIINLLLLIVIYGLFISLVNYYFKGIISIIVAIVLFKMIYQKYIVNE